MEFLYCPNCHKTYAWNDLRLVGGYIPFCPGCQHRFDLTKTKAMTCGKCGRHILFEPGFSDVRCICSDGTPLGKSIDLPGPAIIDWTEQDPSRIVYDHPIGHNLHKSDIVVVREGQEACITANGKEYWIHEPRVCTLAHFPVDRKAENQDDASAAKALPPFFANAIQFIHTALMRFLPVEIKLVLDKDKISLTISLKIDLQVKHAKKLSSAVKNHTEKEIVEKALTDEIRSRLSVRPQSGRMDPSSGASDAVQWLEQDGPAVLTGMTIEQDGIRISNTQDVHIQAKYDGNVTERGNSKGLGIMTGLDSSGQQNPVIRFGVMTWPDGCTYKGQWKDGKRNGQGRMTYASGNVYEGEWQDDCRSGHGVFKWTEGHVYEGEWQNDNRHGRGRMTYASGDVYEGEWLNGNRHGQGRMTYASGNVYEGEWQDDCRSGYGTFRWTEGHIYEGEWQNDKRHGYGKMTYADGTIQEGFWKDDRFGA